jgi:TPR repeat protein
LFLGDLFAEGVGVGKDPARAVDAYARGCKLGNEKSCLKRGITLP